jgi:hypothetical protein
MQRRSLLKLGLASAAVLAVAGGAASLVAPGWTGSALTRGGREVFAKVAETVLDQTLPKAPQEREAALLKLLDRINILVAALPGHAQDELSQLLAVLATSAGRNLLAGLSAPWPEASVAQTQQALQAMRVSTLGVRQQAYAALHEISGAAYFADESTWTVLGYPGPLNI